MKSLFQIFDFLWKDGVTSWTADQQYHGQVWDVMFGKVAKCRSRAIDIVTEVLCTSPGPSEHFEYQFKTLCLLALRCPAYDWEDCPLAAAAIAAWLALATFSFSPCLPFCEW